MNIKAKNIFQISIWRENNNVICGRFSGHVDNLDMQVKKITKPHNFFSFNLVYFPNIPLCIIQKVDIGVMWINYFSCRQQWTVASSPTQVCICSVMTNYATWIDRPFFTVNYQFARRRGNIQIFIFTLHSSHLASSRRNTRKKTLILFLQMKKI